MGADHILTQWVALSLIPNLGGRTLALLLDHFGTTDAILAADDAQLRAVRGIGPKLAAAIRAVDPDKTAAEIIQWQAEGITLLCHAPDRSTINTNTTINTTNNATYPTLLAALPDAPPVLFQRGAYQPGDTRAVAIVGTRQPSPDLYAFAGTMAYELALRGWTIVSGLANGIDAAAHWGALRAGGRTLAVLGSGLNMIYPPQHAGLAALITAQHEPDKTSPRGALFAEIHPASPPNGPTLVARNRLISGLSRALIVVAAGATSGSLHAARFARVQGRTVYVVDSGLAGNQQLIAAGARPIPPDFADWDGLAAEIEQEITDL
ncbi:MAG: DNA-processing protein DprA [Anaerolineae bacterium]|nr:DNA-processing protein DprA [Anaerolineae bacterium]